MTDDATAHKTLDLIAIGRSSVDLYGQQIGCRLEDVASFAKSVGGCPANIAIGTARLGLRSALITRVGAEQMGGFIREQLVREGVVVDGVHTDKDRLSRLVLLAVQAVGGYEFTAAAVGAVIVASFATVAFDRFWKAVAAGFVVSAGIVLVFIEVPSVTWRSALATWALPPMPEYTGLPFASRAALTMPGKGA